MRTLERKHLACYWPYALRFERIVRNDDEDQELIKTMNGVYQDSVTWLIDLWGRKYNAIYCKPLLHPIESVIKTIKKDSESDEFIPLVDLQKAFGEFPYSVEIQGEPKLMKVGVFFEMFDSSGNLVYRIPTDPELMEKRVFEQLAEMHIDLFNLIPDGLAKPINNE